MQLHLEKLRGQTCAEDRRLFQFCGNFARNRNIHGPTSIYIGVCNEGETMKVKIFPRDEIFLGLTVGGAVLLIEISILALLAGIVKGGLVW